VHKKMLAVIVRRDQDGQPQYEKRKFGTTRKEILALAAWLQHWQVSEVVIAYASQLHLRWMVRYVLDRREPFR